MLLLDEMEGCLVQISHKSIQATVGYMWKKFPVASGIYFVVNQRLVPF